MMMSFSLLLEIPFRLICRRHHRHHRCVSAAAPREFGVKVRNDEKASQK